MMAWWDRWHVVGAGLSIQPLRWQFGSVSHQAMYPMWALGPFRFTVRPPEPSDSERSGGGPKSG